MHLLAGGGSLLASAAKACWGATSPRRISQTEPVLGSTSLTAFLMPYLGPGHNGSHVNSRPTICGWFIRKRKKRGLPSTCPRSSCPLQCTGTRRWSPRMGVASEKERPVSACRPTSQKDPSGPFRSICLRRGRIGEPGFFVAPARKCRSPSLVSIGETEPRMSKCCCCCSSVAGLTKS